MPKLILLGADWCPVTKASRELFETIRKEKPDFHYEYIEISSEKGRELVNRFSITSIPKVIFQEKIIFHGLPKKENILAVWKERILPRQLKEKEQEKTRQKKKIKKLFFAGIISLIIGGGIFGLVWYAKTRPSLPESEVISRQGLHWHPNLTIKILGENQDIPAGIGLERLPHKPMHTHDRGSVIHMEFAGQVRANDIRLGQFFKIWGKTFSKDCIFDKCSGPDNQLTMLINGKENLEFENYLMRDGDKIEIIFE